MVHSIEETVLLALATPLSLLFVAVVSSDVGQEVVGPSNELLAKEVEQGYDGSLFAELGEFVGKLAKTGSTFLPSAWYKDHISLHVARRLVVLAVGNLPAEVGNQERRMQDPADGIVKNLGCTERLMSALVGEHPNTGSEETLHHGVKTPKRSTDWSLGYVLGGHVCVEDVEGRAQENQIAENVVESLGGRSFEAVLRNGLVDILDGVVRDSELVAIGIHEFAVRSLLAH